MRGAVPDIIDRANDLVELERQLELQRAKVAPKTPSATGRCLNCDAAVAAPRRWCDSDCRDQWQMEHPAEVGERVFRAPEHALIGHDEPDNIKSEINGHMTARFAKLPGAHR